LLYPPEIKTDTLQTEPETFIPDTTLDIKSEPTTE